MTPTVLDRPRWLDFGGVLWGIAALVVSIAVGATPNGAVQILLTASFLILPGAIALALIDFAPRGIALRVMLAVVVGMTVSMVVGALASWVGPAFGVHHPLDRVPQLWIWGVLIIAGATAAGILRRDPVAYLTPKLTAGKAYASAALLILPAGAALGAFRLNAGHSNAITVAVVVVFIVLLVAMWIVTWYRSSPIPLTALVYAGSLAVAWATTIRGSHLYGWDVQQEFSVAAETIARGRWVIPSTHGAYQSMLSLSVFPAQFHSLAGLDPTWAIKGLFSAILAFVPVGVFIAVRRRTTDGVALFVAAMFVLATISFPAEMPSIGRQALALSLVAAFVAVLNSELSVFQQRAFLSFVGIALAFTHYSTSYFQAALLVFAWLFGLIVIGRSPEARRGTIVTLGPVLITLIAALSWNLLITNNNALSQLSHQNTPLRITNVTYDRTISVYEYQHLEIEGLAKNSPNLKFDVSALAVPLHNTTTPDHKGVIPSLKRAWNDLYLLFRIAINVATVASLAYLAYLWRRKNDEFAPDADWFSIGVAALLFDLLLRFSTALAGFYNPERGQLLGNLYLAVPFALLLLVVARRIPKLTIVAVSGAGAFGLISAFGLTPLVVGGTLEGAYTTKGENVERFVVSQAEYQTAVWMAQNVPNGALAQADRYANLSLDNVLGRAHFGVLVTILPVTVDGRSWIYLSAANTINGRARGAPPDGLSLAEFKSPNEYFYTNRSVVYATTSTRVLH